MWDASCLLYYGGLIEGTLLEKKLETLTAASSVSTVEHLCQKETPSKTRDVPFLLLDVSFVMVSCVYQCLHQTYETKLETTPDGHFSGSNQHTYDAASSFKCAGKINLVFG